MAMALLLLPVTVPICVLMQMEGKRRHANGIARRSHCFMFTIPCGRCRLAQFLLPRGQRAVVSAACF